MEINQRALFDILLQLCEVVERSVEEIERLRGAIYENDKTRERYLAGVDRPDAELNRASIRALRQRLASISRYLRTPES
jgi:hypothetical protein